MTTVRKSERAALRVLAALPDDDWHPEDWAAFDATRAALADLVRRCTLEDERGRTERPRQALRPISERRRRESPIRARVRERVLARDGRCIPAERGMPGACETRPGRAPLEVHEIAARGTHPGSHLDELLCVAACPRHHDDITDATGDLLALVRRLDLRRSPTT